MSMDGRRFGFGLAVGFILSLAIIVSAGATAHGINGPVSVGHSPSFGPVGTTTASVTVTSTTPSYLFGTVPVATLTTSSNETSVLNNLNSQTTNQKGLVGATSSGPTFSSNLASAVQLPTTSRALLLAPLAIASILGAALYRASRSGKSDSEME